jgi:trehalose synthase
VTEHDVVGQASGTGEAGGAERAALRPVDVGVQHLDAYRASAGSAVVDELRQRARRLQGLRVLHLNATPYGGGVAELLRSEVPLLRDLGLRAEWRLVTGDEVFFSATKAIHNALQGSAETPDEAAWAAYEESSAQVAAAFEDDFELVVVHDPQPLPLPHLHGRGAARWIWRCHIDTSKPDPEVWGRLGPFFDDFDAAVFTSAAFVPPRFPAHLVCVIPPAIDPESPKNVELDSGLARRVLGWLGVDLDRPLVVQVSRFDRWKDPLGVIEAFRLARDDVGDLQLALVGSMALDDPEAWGVYAEIQEAIRGDGDIDVFTNLNGVSSIEVNAFQRLATVAVQRSLREGFGLVVSESLWKGTPVVGGRTGGIPLQLADGVGGYLVDSIADCANRIAQLVRDPGEARRLGRLGRRHVRDHYLLPRLLRDELTLYAALLGTD